MSIHKLQAFDGNVQLTLLDLVVLMQLLERRTLLLPGCGVHTHQAHQLIHRHVQVTDAVGGTTQQ